MLEMRPSCENCDKNLPNESNEAMICTHECTFCEACVKDVLNNVCPNCGGGFEKRPTRPTNCFTPNCVEKYPVSTIKKFKPINIEEFKLLLEQFENVEPRRR